MPDISRDVSDLGIQFRITGSSGLLPPSEWALRADEMRPQERRAIPVLQRLLNDEQVEETQDMSILAPHAILASLSAPDLGRLGLPDPAPVTILIENSGLLTDPDFRFLYTLMLPDGRPLQAWSRIGFILQAGSRQWTLPDPLYTLVEMMDAFNSAPSQSTDERFRRWSEIRRHLPEHAAVDGYLMDTQVAFASAFTLDVRASGDGGVSFEPVLVRPASACDPLPETGFEDPDSAYGEKAVDRSLPEAAERSLQQQFRRYREARSRYALGDGWFIAVDEPLRRALQVVREMQQAPPAERRAFAANPHAVLREKLGETFADEDVLEGLFHEPEYYGERVKEAGAWKPKVLPFLRQASEPWLPPEVLGLLVDGRELRIETEDLARVTEEVSAAIRENRPCINYKGELIPADEATLSILEDLKRRAQVADDRPKYPLESKPPVERCVLLLGEHDNLEGLGYERRSLPQRAGESEIPQGLLSRLKPHQKEGLEWLQRHWLDGSPGALLADDMGLGKTLQVLAFLLWMQRQPGFLNSGRHPILVVAPTGLLANWLDEHRLHMESPGLGFPLKAYGPGLRDIRHAGTEGVTEMGAGAPVLKVSRLQEADWVLTTYETQRDYAHSFARVSWAAAVLDEAQKIKNPGALVTEQCKAVVDKADFVITMTGTPVENRLSDLWSIVDTCQPGVLRDLASFVRQYDTNRDPTGRELHELKERISHTGLPVSPGLPLMLRRMKWQELKGLPTKHISDRRADMPREQADAYDRVVADARRAGKSRGGMLRALHHLRSVSLHPRIVGNDEADGTYIQASARLTETFRLLDNIANDGERALIFLESRVLQPILQGLIQRRYGLDHPPMVINGSVAGDSRKQMVRRFQEGGGFDCMILSPKAGGVGLTLTSANHVIHLSRWWNPAVEDQCTDRIYRIGQDKPVFIHIPLAIHPRLREHSFDVKLDGLLRRKRDLSRQVLGLAPGAGGEAELNELYGGTVLETD